MDPSDPLDAQQVVVEYARLLERDIEEQRHPAHVETLPYAKPLIKEAIQTSVRTLAASGQLTNDLSEFLETAYTSLAEYLEGELVELVTQFRDSGEALTQESPLVSDKTNTTAWQTLAQSGALAGELARSTAAEVDALRREFRGFLVSV